MLQLANALSHLAHLLVITFSVVGWAFDGTRLLHLVLCGLVLFSWFVLGPLVGKPGFCFLTGIQHWIWRKLGANGEKPDNYMTYLLQRVTGITPTPRGVKAIDYMTQAVLYTSTALSFALY